MTVDVNADKERKGREVRRAGPPQASTTPSGGSELQDPSEPTALPLRDILLLLVNLPLPVAPHSARADSCG